MAHRILFCDSVSEKHYVMSFANFRAVILAAGNGSRMPELVSNNFPKCLLPVGCRPLIFYTIRMLEKYFSKIEIIVKSSQRVKIEEALKLYKFTANLDLIEIKPESDIGTSISLTFLPERFNEFDNLVVVSCDLITNLDIGQVLKCFQINDSTLLSVWFDSNTDSLMKALQVPGLNKSKFKQERELIAINSNTNQILMMTSVSDLESDKVILPQLNHNINDSIEFFSMLTDSHFYILKKWVFQHLKNIGENHAMTSLKAEFIPNLIKIQFMEDNERDLKILSLDPKLHDRREFMKSTNLIQCHAHIEQLPCFGFRINNLPLYWYLNANINKYFPNKDSKIGQNIRIGKIINKNSIIGNDCDIDNDTRLVNTLLMNGVKISEQCSLENCLVGENVVIKAKSVLKNCLIGHSYEIEQNSILNNEILLSTTDDLFNLSSDDNDDDDDDIED